MLKKKNEFAAAVPEMQEQDSAEDPPAACRHGKDALGRPVVTDGVFHIGIRGTPY